MNKILLVGIVCLSLGAFAQSSSDQGQSSNANTAAPKDLASGQASGKRMHKPLVGQPDASTGTDAGKTSGGKSATDDWSTSKAAKSNGSNNGAASPHVAAADVNGDGKADLKATKNSGHATEQNAVMSSSGSQSSKDTASGQSSGKRQHQPVVIRKEVDAASPK